MQKITGARKGGRDVQCRHCKKKFTTFISILKLGRHKFCSRRCVQKHKRDNFSCTECRKTFSVLKSELRAGKRAGKFCSLSCRFAYKKKRGYSRLTCFGCKKFFMRKRGDITARKKFDHSKRSFCSSRCLIKWSRNNLWWHHERISHSRSQARPTKPEIFLTKLFARHRLPFKYVGNGKLWVGKFNPDFASTDSTKRLIEFLGCYWHKCPQCFPGRKSNRPSLHQRLTTFKKYGYDTLIIWEHELKDPGFERRLLSILALSHDFALSP